MARTANFNGVFERLPAISRLHRPANTRKRPTIVGCFNKKQDQTTQEQYPLQTTRRLALGSIASISFFANSAVPDSLAEDNGFWITSHNIPMTPLENNLDNKETGTRSFIMKGLYIADLLTINRAARVYKYSYDLLAMADLIQQKDVWPYIRRFLHLRATFMYYDFDKLITAAQVEDKPFLLELANRLFDNFEKVDYAVKKKDKPLLDSNFAETEVLLEEVKTKVKKTFNLTYFD